MAGWPGTSITATYWNPEGNRSESVTVKVTIGEDVFGYYYEYDYPTLPGDKWNWKPNWYKAGTSFKIGGGPCVVIK